MFSNFLIGLREGLEAALVTGMLLAILVKTNQRKNILAVWIGVAIAVILSLLLGAILTLGPKGLSFQAQELIGGSLSIIAVALVTWMVFWMGKSAKGLDQELTHQIEAASGSFTAIAFVAFLAVGREGLETALFLWSSTRVQGSVTISGALLAALLGIGVAVLLAWAIMRGVVRLNMKKFFTWTGALLIIVAAGIFSYGIHDLQEANFLPGLNNVIYDISHVISPASWYGTLLKGVFNFSPAPTWFEAIAYWVYIIPTLFLYLRLFGFSLSKQPAKV